MTLTQERQVILFKPQGSIDLDSGTILSEQMAAIEPQHHQLWVIDLSEVDFMDSSGLVPPRQGTYISASKWLSVSSLQCQSSS